MRVLLCLAGLALAGCHTETVRTPIGPSLPVEPTLNATSAGYDDGCACDRQAAAPPLLRPAVTLEHPPGTQIAPPRPEPTVEAQAAPQSTTGRSAVPAGGAYFPFFLVAPPVIHGPQPVPPGHGGNEVPLPPPKPTPVVTTPPPPATLVTRGAPNNPPPRSSATPTPRGSAGR